MNFKRIFIGIVIPCLWIGFPSMAQEKFLAKVARLTGASPMDAGGGSNEANDWNNPPYSTRTPTRIMGNLFFGFAGVVGIGYQGHHPKKPPTFGTAPGGVLASAPPWGPIKSASKIANGFSTDMSLAGWRTSFLLGDDSLNSLDLEPAAGPGSGTGTFATRCNFGLLIGHMTASAYNDPSYYSTTPYYPVYNTLFPGAYHAFSRCIPMATLAWNGFGKWQCNFKTPLDGILRMSKFERA